MLQAAAAEGSKNKKKGKKKLSATGVSNGGIIESAGPSTAAGSITHGDEVTYFFKLPFHKPFKIRFAVFAPRKTITFF